MKKSKFIVFTLLIALFSLCFVNFGSNKQEVYAAEVTLQDEADIAAANVPSTVILSFPVTHISSYGNEIDWEVIDGEEYVSYDRDAKWMVVSRSTEEDRTATLKVTVSDGENSSSATKTITIPAGFTAAPVYKINYNLNDGVNNENNPSSYKLGDATITLQNPTKEGYTFQGWEDAEGNKIEKILVGSRKEISLTATWAEKQLSDVVIKTQPTKLTYNALENFDATGLVVTEYYDNGTQQDVTYVGNESSFAFSVTQLQGTDNGQKVVVTYEGYELETSALTVNRLTYDMSQVKWNHSSPYTYNGEEKEVVLTGLPNGVTATYENNKATKVGNYTASVILDYDEVNYNAPEAIANLSWSIVSATLDMSKVKWNYTQAFTYDGAVKEVFVTDLPNGVTATYEDNDAINAGDYQAKVTFAFDDENYDLVYGENEFSATLDWSIDKAKVYYNAQPEAAFAVGQTPTWEYVYISGLVEGEAESLINLENVTATYWQGEQEVQITQLPAAAEFTAKFTGATADNYDVVINDYTGSISTVSIYFLPSQTYTYNTQAQTFAAKAYYNDNGNPVEITDGTITYSYKEANTAVETNAGTYKVTVTLSGSQYGSLTSIVDFVIEKAEISMKDAAWNYTSAYIYNPEETRTVVLSLPNLVTATYEDNSKQDAGEYNAVATLAYDSDNYVLVEMPQNLVYDANEGTISLYWVINPAQIDMSAVAWDYTDALVYSKSGHTVEVKNLPANVSVEYTGNTGTDVDNYQATATFTPNANYVLINNNLGALDWEIIQATHDMSNVKWNYTQAFTYDNSEKSVLVTGLPEGVEANYGESVNKATAAGDYQAVVTFEYDTTNYKLSYGVNEFNSTLNWSIAKAKIDMTGVDWVYEEGSFTYDSSEKEVLLSTLPEGVKATYSNNKGTDAKEYTATVELAPVDADNYELINVEVEALTWEIQKATYDFAVEWNYTAPYTYSGSDQSVKVTNTPDGLTPVYTGTYSATDADTYTATVTFTNSDNNYNDTDITDTLTWTINPKELTNEDVVITVLGEDKNEQNSATLEPGVKVMYDTVEVTTYALSHSYDAEINKGVVTITLNGNYTGTLTAEFTASDYGQAYVDAQTLATSLEDPTSLPLTVGSSNVFWTNLPTGLILNQETGALSYAKPEADEVYVVEATVYYGSTSSYVVEVTITITGVNQQTSNGVITEGESSQLTVEKENNADYVVYVEGVEQETVAAYNIDFADHTDGDKVTVKIPVPAGYESENLTVWHKVGEEYVNMNAVKEDGYLVFTADSFSPYVVTVAPAEEQPLFDNVQVVIATVRSSGNYFLMTGAVESNRLVAVDSYSATSSVKYYAENQVWTITYVDGNYYLQASNGHYLSWTSGNTAILVEENGKPLTITESAEVEGAYNITFVDGENTRYLSLNGSTGNNYFAFYTGTQKHELIITTNLQQMTSQEKAEIDAADVDTSARTVEESFILPVVGSIFGTQITWESNNAEVIAINGKNATVTRPEAGNGDVVVTLTGTVAGLDETLSITVTVTALPEAGEKAYAWQLVTDASTLKVDDQIVIVAKDYDLALSTTQNSNNRGQAAVTKVDSTITFGEDVQVIKLEDGTQTGTFAFNVKTGYLYAASSSSNYLRTQTTNNDNGSWVITITDGVASVVAQGTYTRNTMRYNKSSTLFSCYSSSSSESDIAVYKYSEVHTCQFSEPTCETPATCSKCGATQGEALGHSEEINWTITLNPTCVAEGLKEGLCTVCNKTVTATIPATGEHNYNGGVCTVCGTVENENQGGSTEPVTESLDIKSTEGKLSDDQNSISWTSDGITVTNVKGSTAIRTSDSDHFRAYQNSITTISGINITKVVITCTSDAYATACVNSVPTEDFTATASGSVVTIIVDSGSVNEIVITATAQWRLNKVEVTYTPSN